jgi:hypothetical protein
MVFYATISARLYPFYFILSAFWCSSYHPLYLILSHYIWLGYFYESELNVIVSGSISGYMQFNKIVKPHIETDWKLDKKHCT